jgi:hypothetical protein
MSQDNVAAEVDASLGEGASASADGASASADGASASAYYCTVFHSNDSFELITGWLCDRSQSITITKNETAAELVSLMVHPSPIIVVFGDWLSADHVSALRAAGANTICVHSDDAIDESKYAGVKLNTVTTDNMCDQLCLVDRQIAQFLLDLIAVLYKSNYVSKFNTPKVTAVNFIRAVKAHNAGAETVFKQLCSSIQGYDTTEKLILVGQGIMDAEYTLLKRVVSNGVAYKLGENTIYATECTLDYIVTKLLIEAASKMADADYAIAYRFTVNQSDKTDTYGWTITVTSTRADVNASTLLDNILPAVHPLESTSDSCIYFVPNILVSQVLPMLMV